jgi:ribonucleoside-diphosphate reductase alpha chain
MSLKALQDYTFVSRYARYDEGKKRRETWNEAVNRVKEMHLRRYPQITNEIEWAFEQVKNKKVLGSQRALQFGGKPIESKHSRLYNCTVSFCDRPRFFQECFWLLLCGCGTGFSVQRHHVDKLPKLFQGKRNFTLDPTNSRPKKKFIIPDSIEGWADALGVLVSSYMPGGDFPEYEGCKVVFDYTQIREEGSKLSACSGKAPGPAPLRKAIEKIRCIFESCLDEGCEKLKPIHCYDIVMHASDAVLSGGVRRSATICLFSPDDHEMATAKTGNWLHENPQRGRSNNSALLIRGKTTKEEFLGLMKSVREYGEPGFVWADSTELCVNPCLVADTAITTNEGLELIEGLINEPFKALVEGKVYKSTEKGFFKTGNRKVMTLEFQSGRTITLTHEHRIMTLNGWKTAEELTYNDEIVLNNQRPFIKEIDVNNKDFITGYCD